MAYEKQSWVDYPLETTPISSERLIHIENGIYGAAESADEAVENAIADAYPNIEYNMVDSSSLFYTSAMSIAGETVDGTEVSGGNTIDIATKNSLLNAKAAIDSKTDSIKYDNVINLTPGSQINPTVCYIDGEHTEQTFEWAENTIPAHIYYLNEVNYMPSNISTEDVPTQLQIYRGYDKRSLYLSDADDDAYVVDSSSYTVLANYLSGTSGSQILISIVAQSTMIGVIVLGLNMTNHTITQVDVGENLGNNLYLYYPCNLIYDGIPRKATVIDDYNASANTTYSSNKIESIVADSMEDTPFYYGASGPENILYLDPNDGNVKGYTNGGPYSVQYQSTLDSIPESLTLVNENETFLLEDATTDIIMDPGSSYDWIKIADISSLGVQYDNCYIAVIGVAGMGTTIYMSMLNTDTRQRTVDLLWNQGMGTSLSFTYPIKAKCIDDTTASEYKTYSSAKIEQLIANLQAQIDNLT